jgi:hypothetical protein
MRITADWRTDFLVRGVAFSLFVIFCVSANLNAASSRNPHILVESDVREGDNPLVSVTTHSIALTLSILWEDAQFNKVSSQYQTTLATDFHSLLLRGAYLVPTFYASAALATAALGPGGIAAAAAGTRALDITLKELTRRPGVPRSHVYGFRKMKYSLNDRLVMTDILLGYRQEILGQRGYAKRLYLNVTSRGQLLEGYADYETIPSHESEKPELLERVPFYRIQIIRPCMKLIQQAAYYLF